MKHVFRFSDLETSPPATLYAHALLGGLNLGAFDDDALVGWIPAFPGYQDGRAFLFSSGLSVIPERQSDGIGGMLLAALGREARVRGYETVRWTTNPMISRNLYLYLGKGDAEIIGYHPMLYEGLIAAASPEGIDGDEVEIEWDLARPAPASRDGASVEEVVETALTSTDDIGNGLRRLRRVTVPKDTRHAVEVPWDAPALASVDVDLVTYWRRGLGEVLVPLIDHGYRGVDVVLDRAAHRSFVIFARPA